MNIQNPKLVSFLQTVFYSAAVVIIPLIVQALGVGGAFDGVLPAGVTGIIIWILNYYDNKLSAQKGGAFFGAVE